MDPPERAPEEEVSRGALRRLRSGSHLAACIPAAHPAAPPHPLAWGRGCRCWRCPSARSRRSTSPQRPCRAKAASPNQLRTARAPASPNTHKTAAGLALTTKARLRLRPCITHALPLPGRCGSRSGAGTAVHAVLTLCCADSAADACPRVPSRPTSQPPQCHPSRQQPRRTQCPRGTPHQTARSSGRPRLCTERGGKFQRAGGAQGQPGTAPAQRPASCSGGEEENRHVRSAQPALLTCDGAADVLGGQQSSQLGSVDLQPSSGRCVLGATARLVVPPAGCHSA